LGSWCCSPHEWVMASGKKYPEFWACHIVTYKRIGTSSKERVRQQQTR
jgi:hypothetical protein